MSRRDRRNHDTQPERIPPKYSNSARFRESDSKTGVVVPTSFNSVTEEEFAARGVNIVIYANQLTRSAFPAMRATAETILKNHRALEADRNLMPFKDIITLIDEI